MSKAREIAEERFARGEISEKELQSILNRLKDSENQIRTSVPAPAPAKKSGGGISGVFKLIGTGLFIFFGVGFLLQQNSVGGLETANITAVSYTHLTLPTNREV